MNLIRWAGWLYRWGTHQMEPFWITSLWKPHSSPHPEMKCHSILFLYAKPMRPFIKIAGENHCALAAIQHRLREVLHGGKNVFKQTNLSLVRLHWHANSFHQCINDFRKHTHYVRSAWQRKRQDRVCKSVLERKQLNIIMGVTTSYIRKIKGQHLSELKQNNSAKQISQTKGQQPAPI